VPFKMNADRRHHIPRQRHRVTNWAEYDAALRLTSVARSLSASYEQRFDLSAASDLTLPDPCNAVPIVGRPLWHLSSAPFR
jgi:hypothetical protein